MERPILFPDEIAEILRERDRSGAVVRTGAGQEFTAGQLDYGLYASGRLYIEKDTGRIVDPYNLALMIYDAIESGCTAHIDDYRIGMKEE